MSVSGLSSLALDCLSKVCSFLEAKHLITLHATGNHVLHSALEHVEYFVILWRKLELLDWPVKIIARFPRIKTLIVQTHAVLAGRTDALWGSFINFNLQDVTLPYLTTLKLYKLESSYEGKILDLERACPSLTCLKVAARYSFIRLIRSLRQLQYLSEVSFSDRVVQPANLFLSKLPTESLTKLTLGNVTLDASDEIPLNLTKLSLRLNSAKSDLNCLRFLPSNLKSLVLRPASRNARRPYLSTTQWPSEFWSRLPCTLERLVITIPEWNYWNRHIDILPPLLQDLYIESSTQNLSDDLKQSVNVEVATMDQDEATLRVWARLKCLRSFTAMHNTSFVYNLSTVGMVKKSNVKYVPSHYEVILDSECRFEDSDYALLPQTVSKIEAWLESEPIIGPHPPLPSHLKQLLVSSFVFDPNSTPVSTTLPITLTKMSIGSVRFRFLRNAPLIHLRDLTIDASSFNMTDFAVESTVESSEAVSIFFGVREIAPYLEELELTIRDHPLSPSPTQHSSSIACLFDHPEQALEFPETLLTLRLHFDDLLWTDKRLTFVENLSHLTRLGNLSFFSAKHQHSTPYLIKSWPPNLEILRFPQWRLNPDGLAHLPRGLLSLNLINNEILDNYKSSVDISPGVHNLSSANWTIEHLRMLPKSIVIILHLLTDRVIVDAYQLESGHTFHLPLIGN